MSLRRRLALALLLLASLVGALEALAGYWSFRNLVERDIQGDLVEVTERVRRALELTPSGPRLARGDIFGTHYVFGFRLLEGGEAVLEGGFSPREGEAWRTQRTAWQGYTLEVSLRVEEYRRALATFLRAALLPLLPLLGLAGFLGLLLADRLTRPLAALGQALDHLSRLRFPKPLPEPGEGELARVVRAFNRMARSVQMALERERAFTRHASHELRTPLAVLQAQVEALQGEHLSPAQALPEMGRALARMRATLSGLLELARLEGSDLSPVELGAFLRARLPEQVRLLAAGPAWVLAHEGLLERVLANLLENAERHGKPPVEVGLEVGEKEVRLSVRDHGPGAPPGLLARLGEPFVTGPAGGTGLGLALVRQVAAWLGGRVEVENALPGLRVALVLPRWRDVDAA
ncbi:HAMP domain-containing sensor histidine kinase [Thermus sp. FJN-A]